MRLNVGPFESRLASCAVGPCYLEAGLARKSAGRRQRTLRPLYSQHKRFARAKFESIACGVRPGALRRELSSSVTCVAGCPRAERIVHRTMRYDTQGVIAGTSRLRTCDRIRGRFVQRALAADGLSTRTRSAHSKDHTGCYEAC